MSAKTPIEMKKCITPEFRVSWPSVFEAKAFEDQEAKFSITMLFDKKTDITALKRACHNAAVEKWGSDKTKWPKSAEGRPLRMPFTDGDLKTDVEGYAGTTVVKATSKQRPGVVDQQRHPITADDRTFYGGCYARAELLAFAYDHKGNRGVSFGLQNVQKLRDGKSFSGRKAAEDVFDAIEDNTNNMDSYDGVESGDAINAGF